MYFPNSKWTWSFMGVAIVQAVIALALEGYVFAKFQISYDRHIGSQQDDRITSENPTSQTNEQRSIPTYLSLLIFGFIYELVLVYDALRLKNTIQIIGLCLYNLGILVYTAIQVDQIDDAVSALANAVGDDLWMDIKPFLIAVPCVVSLGTLCLSFIAWKLYDEFAWTIYKKISADLRMKRRFLIFQIYIALLKFDFFFFLGFTVQFLVIVVNTTDVEFYLTIAALVATIIVLFLAGWFTRRESLLGMLAIIVLYFCALAYFLFKLIRMYSADPRRKADYLPARRSLTTFAVITILLLVVTIVIACWCTHNFGMGLKQYVQKGSRRSADGEVVGDKLYLNDMGVSMGPVGLAPERTGPPGTGRMVID
ncbi:hypothetical protein K402DRAFT_328293 [Aulographum hederae CBS 113979]|uniref:Uncharacterized protein n=1 Tax=Aulographum hederae CBS 113979 TaxID=1176131 RepID=A0A6G1H5D7_9PEZI|nr:hypothetical protein K402DRAFT_328293 [Aulographum hederae CBS 113979]